MASLLNCYDDTSDDELEQFTQLSVKSNVHICDSCGEDMLYIHSDLKYSCKFCGTDIFETLVQDDNKEMNSPGQLKIIGENSQKLQLYLYRNEKTPPEQVKKLIYDEFVHLLENYKEKVGRLAFPLNAIKIATDYQYEVINFRRCRKDLRHWVMASCLQIACISINYAPAKTDLINMFLLNSRGLAPGINILLEAKEHGALTFEVNFDPREAEFYTLFSHIGNLLSSEEHDLCSDVAMKIFNHMVKMAICSASFVRSKVVGITFTVLNRRLEQKNVITVSNLCDFAGIQKNTVDRFIREMNSFHKSQFKQFYDDAGLRSD